MQQHVNLFFNATCSVIEAVSIDVGKQVVTKPEMAFRMRFVQLEQE